MKNHLGKTNNLSNLNPNHILNQRKYIEILEWEAKRQEQSQKHRKIIEGIFTRFFQQGTIRKEVNLAIGKYLKERSVTDLEYSQMLQEQLVYLPRYPTSNDSHSLRTGLASVSSLQENLSNKLRTFSRLIESEFIHTDIASTFIEYDKEITEAQARAETVFKRLDALSAKTEKAFKYYVTLFQSVNKTAYSPWVYMRKYLSVATEGLSLQVEFAESVFSLWKKLNELDIERIKTIKSTMEKFVSYHREIFSVSTEGIEQSIKNISEDVSESLSLEKLLNGAEREWLEEFGGNGETPFEQLMNWNLQTVDISDLVVIEGELLRETRVFRSWKKSYAIVTIDRFLYIFEDKEAVSPLESCFLLDGEIVVTSDQEEEFFEVIESRKSGLFKKLAASKKVVLRSEFMDKWVKVLQALTW